MKKVSSWVLRLALLFAVVYWIGHYYVTTLEKQTPHFSNLIHVDDIAYPEEKDTDLVAELPWGVVRLYEDSRIVVVHFEGDYEMEFQFGKDSVTVEEK